MEYKANMDFDISLLIHFTDFSLSSNTWHIYLDDVLTSV